MKMSFVRKTLPSGLLIAIMLSLATAQSASAEMVRLPGHVPALSFAPPRARSSNVEEVLPLAAVLALRNQDQLRSFIADVSNPASASYGKYLSVGEFDKKFSPSPAQRQKVVNYLTGLGFNVTEVSPFIINFLAPRSLLEKSLQFHFNYFQMPDGRKTFAPAVDPMVDVEVAAIVQSFVGLSNIPKFHHASKITDASHFKATPSNNQWTPQALNKAYNFPSVGVKGLYQTLALVELDGYLPSDTDKYAQQFGLKHPAKLETILLDGFNGAAGPGAGEVVLDIDMMRAVAPQASKIIVYEGQNTNVGVLDIYKRAARDNQAAQISTSWGAAEDFFAPADLNAENAVFMELAAQGQALFAASGDSGAYDDGTNLTVDDPGSNPYVTSVGGTVLTVNKDGTYASESSWGDAATSTYPASGGGGGVSAMWSLPSWQKGLATAANLGSNKMRMVPDVSINAGAYGGYPIYISGKLYLVSGTSCAAPIWAAYVSMINQLKTNLKGHRVGYLNPQIYAWAAGPWYHKLFHDINDNSNNLYYPAVNGYDLSTGLGSMVPDALAIVLTYFTP